jgi:hypothetical protein
MDPGPFVRAMVVGTVVLTTDADGVTLRHPLLVMVDGSVLPRILDRYSGRVGLMWNVYEVTGDTCPWSSFA